MVVFTCSHCGESLQKPRVEKHYQTTCSQNPISVSCMDCFKDFKLQEYVAHTKCVTEEERYAAKGTVHGAKKGEMKQSSWVSAVNEIINQQQDATSDVKSLLELISKHNNIPRKKVKFVNFVNSMSGGRTAPGDIETVWGLIQAHMNAEKAKNEAASPKENTTENKNKSPKKKKQKSEAASDTNDKDSVLKTKSEDTISPVTEETADELNSSKKNKKRKGKKAGAREVEAEAKGETVTEEGESPKKKKKKSGQNSETQINGNSKIETNGDNQVNGETQKKKKKKNKSAKLNGTQISNEVENTPKNNLNENGANDKKLKKKKNGPKENSLKESPADFCWRQEIIDVLKVAPQGLQKEKVKELVFEKYETVKGKIIHAAKMSNMYNKKFKKIGNIKVENNMARLVE